jgi:ABC-type transport system involved in multi-copper enzyme maturation permease subunit
LLVAGFALTIHPLLTLGFVPIVAAMYLAFGGVGFLLSTLWRYDWLSLVTVAVVSSVAWAMWGEEPGIRGRVVYLLPPMHRAQELYAYAAGVTSTFPWTTQLWLSGYGAVCFAIGLWILRTRSLAPR